MRALLIFFVSLSLSLSLCVGADAESSWPADVQGHVAPKAGEHPRLFFRRADLPALRAKAKTPLGQAVVKRLRVMLNGGDGATMPGDMGHGPGDGGEFEHKSAGGVFTISHVAGYGMLYQLTGERKYADLGRKAMDAALTGYKGVDDRYSFKDPNGALRAGPSLGWYAVGYDLCYDGWDEDYRRKIAKAIENYDEGKFESLEELVRGARHMPASNHWGMQVGGGALAILAIMNDPGVDQKKIDKLLEQSQKAMIRNMTEGFGDGGWFAEGDGTGCMASNISFAPALQAWKTAGGKDFISPRPNAPWMYLKWVMRTIPRNGEPDVLKLAAYPHNVYARDGISGPGTYCIGFGAVREEQKPALLWMYNRAQKPYDDKNNTPCETTSEYPHHAVMALINFPFDMKEKNPIECMPPAKRDSTYGFYMMRNRWKDENDVLVQVPTASTRGWHKFNSRGEVYVWGLGEKRTWGNLRMPVTHYQPAGDGSAIIAVRDGTCLAVDYSKAAGVDAMLVMTGPGATKGDAAVELGGTTLHFLFLTQDDKPKPTVRGEVVVVGKQEVSLKDGRIVLSKMTGPWKESGE